MTKKWSVPLLLALTCVLCHAPHALADSRSFNSTWNLNEEGSQTFEDAGKERNKELLQETCWSRCACNKFPKDPGWSMCASSIALINALSV